MTSAKGSRILWRSFKIEYSFTWRGQCHLLTNHQTPRRGTRPRRTGPGLHGCEILLLTRAETNKEMFRLLSNCTSYSAYNAQNEYWHEDRLDRFFSQRASDELDKSYEKHSLACRIINLLLHVLLCSIAENFYSLFVFWLPLRARQNTAQLVKIVSDTTQQNV